MKPLLAATISEEQIETYDFSNCIASPKIDGIRAIKVEGAIVSRSLKPIPNIHAQEVLASVPEGVDGELVVQDNGEIQPFNKIQSALMSVEGKPDVGLLVFDNYLYPGSYLERLNELEQSTIGVARVLEYHSIDSKREFLKVFDMYEGYEGIMFRKKDSRYKFGRSTLNEGCLVKYKKMKYAVGMVLSVECKKQNSNPATKNALGNTERSSRKEGMVNMETSGKLVVNTIWGVVRIGTGFTDEQRKYIWNNQSSLMGKMVDFKYQEIEKDLPRFPVFVGFCDVQNS